MNTDGGGLCGCRPILCVECAANSIVYYVNVLGFRLGWAWSGQHKRFLDSGESIHPTFALVGRGQVQLMLAEQSQGAPGMWLHIDVNTSEQIDSLFEEWQQRGAIIAEPPSVRPWGMYEMRIRDPDGHMFRVSAPPVVAPND